MMSTTYQNNISYKNHHTLEQYIINSISYTNYRILEQHGLPIDRDIDMQMSIENSIPYLCIQVYVSYLHRTYHRIIIIQQQKLFYKNISQNNYHILKQYIISSLSYTRAIWYAYVDIDTQQYDYRYSYIYVYRSIDVEEQHTFTRHYKDVSQECMYV